ncbi:MAG: hypothetical protein E3J72_21175 [Planctomycetota bacterium]|nr:MAG: hypothetical protein E3J72_21175 [Planctomycetota bacterium]
MLGKKETRYRINEEGFRGPLRERCDIAVLGDSMAFGVGVELEETWGDVLGQKTGLIVSNYSRFGACPQQERIIFNRYAKKKKPALVICSIYYNDFWEVGYFESWKKSGKTFMEYAEIPPSPGRCRLKIYLEAKLLGKWKKRKQPHYDRTPDKERKTVRDTIVGMRDDCAAAGARFALLLFPSIDKVYGDKEYIASKHYKSSNLEIENADSSYLREMCREMNIPFLDLTESLSAAVASGREDLFVIKDNHFSVQGNAFVAEQTHKWLQSAGLLPKK